MTKPKMPRRHGWAALAPCVFVAASLVAVTTGHAAGVRPAGPTPGAGEGITVTAVADGRLLVYGGGSAQAWNPELRTWQPDARGGDLARRFHHTATVTPSGRVVAVGGLDVPFTNRTQQPALASTATWRAHSGRWENGPSLLSPRLWHAAVAMPVDDVLLIGGVAAATGDQPFGTLLTSVELLGENASVQKAPLHTGRILHTATRLADGKVLVTGGVNDAGAPLASTEIYDPIADRWQAGAALATPRSRHDSTLLPDGRVLVSGGRDADGAALGGTEIYDPARDTWSRGPDLIEARWDHHVVVLPDGGALAAGGWTREQHAAAGLESWVATDRVWRPAGQLTRSLRDLHVVPLADGTVLLFGQDSYEGALAFAWRRDLTDDSSPPIPHDGALTALPDGRFMLTGGSRRQAATPLVNVFDPARGTWSALRPLHAARKGHRAIALRDGRVVVFGGDVAGDDAAERTPISERRSHPAEIWDPAREDWTQSASLALPDGAWAEPSLLPDGRVQLLAIDPNGRGDAVAMYRIWDPRDDSLVGPVSVPRPRFGGAVLRYPDGGLVLLGGERNRGDDDDSRRGDRWDPVARQWRPLSPASLSLEGAEFLPLVDGGALAIWRVPAQDGTQRPYLRLLPDGSWRTLPPPPDVTPRSVLRAESLSDGALLLDVDGARSWVHDAKADRWTAIRHDVRWTETLTIVPTADGRALAFRSSGTRGYGLDTLEVSWLDRREGRWTPAAPGWQARPYPALVDLGHGEVLAAGGESAVVQIFDGATDRWRYDAFLPEPLERPSAILARDGRVLLAGITAGDAPAVLCLSWKRGEREWTPCGRFVLAPGEPRRPIALRELDAERLLMVYGNGRAMIRDRTGTWTASRMQLPQSPVPPDADATGTPYNAALAGVWDPQRNAWADATDAWFVNGAQVVPVRGAAPAQPWILQWNKWRSWDATTRTLTGVVLKNPPRDSEFGAALRVGERCAVAWNDAKDARDRASFVGGATTRTIQAVDLAKAEWQSSPAPALAVWRASGIALGDGTILLAGLGLSDERSGAGAQRFRAVCGGVVATSTDRVLFLPSRAASRVAVARDANVPPPKPRPTLERRIRDAFTAIVDEAREHPQRSLLPGLLILLLLRGVMTRWSAYAGDDVARLWRPIDTGVAFAGWLLAAAALAIPHEAARLAAMAVAVLLSAAAVYRLWHNAEQRGTKIAVAVPLVAAAAIGALLAGMAIIHTFKSFIGNLTA